MATRVQLFGDEFDQVVKDHGIICDYYPAMVCECITKDSQQPQGTCSLCGGSGFRYLKPTRIRVVVTSFSSRYTHEIMTLREPGTAYATPQPDIIMGFHDRLIFPDFKCKYSERLWIKIGETVSEKTYRNIRSVITIAKGNAEFELDKDYVVSEDEYHIEFTKPIEDIIELNDDDIEDGYISLSILYYTSPSYLVQDLLHELRSHYTERYVPSETFEELPKQYLIKREDFVYDVDLSAGERIMTPQSESELGDNLFD